MKRIAALLALTGCLTTPWARAQQSPEPPAPGAPAAPSTGDIEALDLEDLLDTHISSVSRRDEDTALAPASVFVVSAEDIRAQGLRTVAEVLRTVPGLFVHDDTLYPMAGVRGIAPLGDMNTRLLVLIDGHPLNNSVGIGQSYLGRDLPVDVTALERIEVIKGPVGSVYGPAAFFGVVNLVTRSPGEVITTGVRAGGELGQLPNAGDLSLNHLGSAGGLAWSLHLGLRRATGAIWRFPELVGLDRDIAEGGLVAGADWSWSNQAYGTLRYADFQLQLGWNQRDKALPTAPYSTLIGDPRNHLYNRTGFAQLSWSRALTDRVELYARAGYDDFHYADDLAYPEPPDDAGMFYDVGRNRWLSGEVRATLTPFAGHRDLIGVELQRHATLQRAQYRDLPTQLEDPVEGFGLGDITRDFTTLNAYALVEQTLFEERLRLHGGLTFYLHELFGSRFTPKLAAVWRATPADTLKAIYSEGFRPPNMFETAFEDGLDFIANDALSPEHVRSAELGYEHQFEGVATVGAALFAARYEQLIRTVVVQDALDPATSWLQFQNVARASTAGLDAYFQLRLRHTVRAYGGFTAQAISYEGDEAAAANFAPFTANLAVSSNAFYEPLTLALHGVFVSERAKDASTVVLPDDRTAVPAYLVLNASARFELPWVRGLGAQLTVFNLLDTEVADPVTGDHAPLSEVRHPGRTLRLEMEYRF